MTERILVVVRGSGEAADIDCKGAWGNSWGKRSVLDLDHDGGYMGIQICQNS